MPLVIGSSLDPRLLSVADYLASEWLAAPDGIRDGTVTFDTLWRWASTPGAAHAIRPYGKRR
jgi:hypothetical protein